MPIDNIFYYDILYILLIPKPQKKMKNPFLRKLFLIFKKEKSLLDIVWLHNYTSSQKKKVLLIEKATELYKESEEVKLCDSSVEAENSFLDLIDTVFLIDARSSVLTAEDIKAAVWLEKWKKLNQELYS